MEENPSLFTQSVETIGDLIHAITNYIADHNEVLWIIFVASLLYMGIKVFKKIKSSVK